jgi:hypothetical protein
MHSQRARDLAKFLAPVLENAADIAAEPGSPDGCSCHETVAGSAEPAVDFAVALELCEVRKKLPAPPKGGSEQAKGEFRDHLARVLDSDDRAVGVLWALLAGRGDQLHADALPDSLACPPGRGSTPGNRTAPGGRQASDGSSGPYGWPHKLGPGLRRAWARLRRTALRLRPVWVSLWMNAIVALVLFLAWWWAWPPLQVRPQAGALSLEVFAVWALSFLPGWLYIRFLGQRAGALWDEYVLNLHRLRWDKPSHLPKPPVNSDFYAEWLGDGGPLLAYRPNIYQQKFDAYYGRSVSRSGHGEGPPIRVEALFPVFLTTAALAVCWTAVLWSPSFTSAPAGFWDVLKFGFLGAYSFILQMLVRRFFQGDLRPAAYANALLRLIVVLILVPALYQIMPHDNPQAAAAVAFVIGFFPLAGMQAIQRFAATALRVVVPSLNPPYPLNQIDGLSVWYEARLLEEGIEDMQSLATANFVDVILHTRVPVGRLVDWVDQAHLYLHLDRLEGTWRERKQAKKGPGPQTGDRRPQSPDSPAIVEGSVTGSMRAGSKTRTALRQLGIRNATDLLKAFPAKRLGLDPGGDKLVPGSPWQEYLDEVAVVQGLDQAQLRTIVRVLDKEPSLAPVWNWQKRGVHKYVPPEPEGPVTPPSQQASVNGQNRHARQPAGARAAWIIAVQRAWPRRLAP